MARSGCTKSLTALSIVYENPNPDNPDTPVSYYEGHYFAYQTFDSQGNRRYHEGRVNLGGTPSPTANFRYKVERDLTVANRWCNFVNNSGTYCITLPGVNSNSPNYNVAGYVTVGIESADDTHTFTNNNKTENIWYYPFGSSGYERIGNMTDTDSVATTRVWYSTYTPYVPPVGNTPGIVDSVTYKNQ